MMPFDKVEQYLSVAEQYVSSSISAVTNGLPDVHEVANQLWVDISRYGPGLPAFPDVRIPPLGDFQVPPPPVRTPPPPESWVNQTADWVAKHPWKTTGIAVGTVGVGLLVHYNAPSFIKRRRHQLHASQKANSVDRRQIVVVLGGDSPYGLALIRELERKKYIVIASVATPDAAEELESQCKGYVKAHVLDPFEPSTVPMFLRSLSASLSRKFPINSSGDPFASPSSLPYIHSVISLLTIAAPLPAVNAPLEHISLHETYVPYLTATQITPLQVIQALLPLLRTGSARSRDKGKNSIVVCLPATDVHAGLPFASVQAMSAAGTLRAVEVLRREIRVAALTDKSEAMRNINVVIVDVGDFDIGTPVNHVASDAIYKAMESWTASEKLAYGPAFVSTISGPSTNSNPRTIASSTFWEQIHNVFHGSNGSGTRRKQSELSLFANALAGVVSEGRHGLGVQGLGIGIGRLRYWLRGERFSVGAGAQTYRLASQLPTILLDGLLNLPHFLISLRNRLVTVQPFRQPPTRPTRTTQSPTQPLSQPSYHHPRRIEMAPPRQAPDLDNVVVENVEVSDHESIPSDTDLDSNMGEDHVGSSWVSLNEKD